MKKLLVTQRLPEKYLAELGRHCDVATLDPARPLADERNLEAVTGCHGLICLLTDDINRAMVEQMAALEFVSSVSVGVDHVDVHALSERHEPARV